MRPLVVREMPTALTELKLRENRRRRRSEGEEGLRTIPEVLLPCGEEVFGEARVSLLSFRNSLLFIAESYVVLATKGGLDGLYNAQIFFFSFFF